MPSRSRPQTTNAARKKQSQSRNARSKQLSERRKKDYVSSLLANNLPNEIIDEIIIKSILMREPRINNNITSHERLVLARRAISKSGMRVRPLTKNDANLIPTLNYVPTGEIAVSDRNINAANRTRGAPSTKRMKTAKY